MKQAGVCPNCDTNGQLIYGVPEFSDGRGQVFYRFRCDICNTYGKEYYTLTYTDTVRVG